MKKLLLFIISYSLFTISYSQIPNASFEYWKTDSVTTLSSWPFVIGNVSRVPGYNSNYAVKLQADTTNDSPGVVLYGYSNDGQTFSGGIPCPYQPDSIQGYFKYSIQAGDSAGIVVLLKNAGTILAYNWFWIKGTNTTDFIKLKFKINYISTLVTPDSLIVGIASTLGQTQHNKGYIIADSIALTGINFSIPNGGFESWTTKSYANPDSGWTSLDYAFSQKGDSLPVTKTIDSYQGEYAALIQNYIHGNDTVYGGLATGQLNSASFNTPAFPVVTKPDFLTGYYKFFPQNGDTMIVAVNLFKNHASIGVGAYINFQTTATYQPFTATIHYSNGTDIPDSATIIIMSFWGQHNSKVHGNSKLFIDALAFSNNPTNIRNNLTLPEENFNVYPNPLKNTAIISYNLINDSKVLIELYDITGQKIKTIFDSKQNTGEYTLDFNRGNLTQGIYELRLITDNETFNKRIVIE